MCVFSLASSIKDENIWGAVKREMAERQRGLFFSTSFGFDYSLGIFVFVDFLTSPRHHEQDVGGSS